MASAFQAQIGRRHWPQRAQSGTAAPPGFRKLPARPPRAISVSALGEPTAGEVPQRACTASPSAKAAACTAGRSEGQITCKSVREAQLWRAARIATPWPSRSPTHQIAVTEG